MVPPEGSIIISSENSQLIMRITMLHVFASFLFPRMVGATFLSILRKADFQTMETFLNFSTGFNMEGSHVPVHRPLWHISLLNFAFGPQNLLVISALIVGYW